MNENFTRATIMRCSILQDMFCIAAHQGVDSEWLARTMMTTQFGINVMKDYFYVEWASPYYMFDCLKREFELQYGKVYDDFILEYVAYLYKYWVDVYNTEPTVIYSYAPIDVVYSLYYVLHVESYDRAIQILIDYTESGDRASVATRGY